MTDQQTIELHLKAIDAYNTLVNISGKFIQHRTNSIYWKRQRKNAQANSAYIYQRFIRPSRHSTYKEINIGFILLNKDMLNLQQMASELGVSVAKIRATLKEYHIPYKSKRSNLLINIKTKTK